MLDVSCKNAYTLTDASLPGGTATGKIKSWRLSVDGATGTTQGTVTIAVAVGNGATYTAAGATGKCAVLSALVAAAQETHRRAGAVAAHRHDLRALRRPAARRSADHQPHRQRRPDPDADRHQRPGRSADAADRQPVPGRDDPAAVLNENPTTIALTLRSLEPFDTVAHTSR
jgi:hypothetical protein